MSTSTSRANRVQVPALESDKSDRALVDFVTRVVDRLYSQFASFEVPQLAWRKHHAEYHLDRAIETLTQLRDSRGTLSIAAQLSYAAHAASEIFQFGDILEANEEKK